MTGGDGIPLLFHRTLSKRSFVDAIKEEKKVFIYWVNLILKLPLFDPIEGYALNVFTLRKRWGNWKIYKLCSAPGSSKWWCFLNHLMGQQMNSLWITKTATTTSQVSGSLLQSSKFSKPLESFCSCINMTCVLLHHHLSIISSTMNSLNGQWNE